jgi:hypothetical protein
MEEPIAATASAHPPPPPASDTLHSLAQAAPV